MKKVDVVKRHGLVKVARIDEVVGAKREEADEVAPMVLRSSIAEVRGKTTK